MRQSLGDPLVLTGHIPHQRVPAMVAAFDIGVVPDAAFYQCPLEVLEGMAAGKAVVAPRYAPLIQIIEDGVERLLFTPRDSESLSDTVLRLVVDPALCSRLGLAAVKKIQSSLSWEHNAVRVLSICEQVLGKVVKCHQL